MMQSLAPTCLRPTRPSLRHSWHLLVALASADDSDLSARVLQSDSSLATEPRQEEESDQESHDTENLAENLAWPEALSERQSAQRSSTASSLCSIPKPGRGAERTR